MLNIVNGKCPKYFSNYVTYVKDSHIILYTIASSNHGLVIPKYHTNSGIQEEFACGTL